MSTPTWLLDAAYATRRRVAIYLKASGCALLHGRGNHLWREAEFYGYVITACRSCGAYRDQASGKAIW